MLQEQPTAPQDPRAKMRLGVKIYLIASATFLATVMIGASWVLYSRSLENRRLVERAAAMKREADQRAIEMLGGKRFEILSFYAMPGIIRRGEDVQLCYGVSNAKVVRLDPPIDAVWPSYSRCVSASPRKTTTYKLTAENAAGETKTSSVTVEVQ